MRSFLVSLCCLVAVTACGGNQAADDFASTPCSDGLDNDGDGNTDFPDDLGCTSLLDDTEDSPTSPQCNDGRDNDGDGKADFPDDPGCFARAGDSEEDDCPDGPFCPQCGNGQDDDMNGATDYPEDQGCESAADTTEFINNPVACGPMMKIKPLPQTGMDSGTFDGASTSNIGSPCGGGGGAPAVAYVINLSQPKVIVASTEDSGTTADTVLDIRRANCSDPGAGLSCNDNISGDNNTSMLTQSLDAGTYYLIVSAYDNTEVGDYTLYVQLFNGEGTECASQEDCGPGLLCRTPIGSPGMICAQPACNDGLDDDNDGKIDYPNDPGCASPNGNNEVDNCPGPAGCPECANTLDDDNDGMIDYPADTTCKAAGDASESCISSEGVELIIQRQTTGTTVGSTNDFNPTCDTSSGAAPDKHFRLDLPAMTSLRVNTTGFDVTQTLLDTTCVTTANACSDPELFTTGALAAGTYYLVVDGYFTTSQGAYAIDVSGTIANGQPCDAGPLAASGALSCGVGFACKGPTVGAKICQLAQCNDNVDNNGNGGKKDFPNDPACVTLSDDTEDNVCPGASCPVCSDGIDNDLDAKIDYPMDTSCVAASGTSETCVATEGTTVLTMPNTTGDTSQATDDIKLSCALSTSTGKDLVYELKVPLLQGLKFTLTSSFDAATAVLAASCQNPSLACSDPNTLTMTNVAAGTYYYVVDGWSTGSGTFTVKTEGVIAPNQSCESPLAQSGALVCAANHSCQGTAGSRTCKPATCSDGVDNNADGKKDFPEDPGCTSAGDDENTVCPGAGCPTCGNGLDDDTDGTTDFVFGGGDIGCTSASAMSETFCTGEPDFGVVISTFETMGTFAGAADNYDQTCQSSTGVDRAFALQLPVPVVSLVIDTNDSTASDTVVSLKDATCGTNLGCDDDGGTPGNQSKLTVANVAPGNYAIQVDAYQSNTGDAFKLHVKGTVAAQTACTSPLFAAGVLACPTGTTCTTGKCQ